VAEVDEATRTLRRFLKTRGVGREGLDVLLLFREAALNAALHGLQHAPGGKAEAEIALEGGAARIRIQDPGPGFDWRSASFDAPHPEAESGRGLFVIAANADRVAFNESGNAIELYKHLGEQP
jgi:serine/threonine-protein kinase RsbW